MSENKNYWLESFLKNNYYLHGWAESIAKGNWDIYNTLWGKKLPVYIIQEYYVIANEILKEESNNE